MLIVNMLQFRFLQNHFASTIEGFRRLTITHKTAMFF